jgi:predicted enzyme related to lactoylglutathione lyase
MPGEDRYIPGVPCWIDTSQPDPEAAVAFYGDLFGWQIDDVMPSDSPVKYFIARLPGGDVAGIGQPPEGGGAAAVWNTYVWVSDADETTAKVRAAGGAVLAEPMEVGEDGRMAIFADPAGAAFRIWEPGKHRGATVVNEHASLNFNVLTTPDHAAAEAFYGAVFGWEVLDVGGAPMWALAGYGDFLEQRSPGLRENMAQMGAPERFEDVVASINPAGEGNPRWDVTFGVEDADAIASRATELGGRVIAPPFDAPWVRMTVVADPQGAVFTASKFVPENAGLTAGDGAAVSA